MIDSNLPRYYRGKAMRLWNGKPMPYYQILRLDDFNPDLTRPKDEEEFWLRWLAWIDDIDFL